MTLTVSYDSKHKRIILSQGLAGEDIHQYRDDAKKHHVHYAKPDGIAGDYQFAVYVDAVMPERLAKSKEFIEQHGWTLQIHEGFFGGDGFFDQIGRPEYKNKNHDEQIACLFEVTTYDVVNCAFLNYQQTVNSSRLRSEHLDSEWLHDTIGEINQRLIKLPWAENDSIMDNYFTLDVPAFVRQLIDEECEWYHCHYQKYLVPVHSLYVRHKARLLAPLDWEVRKEYLRNLTKKQLTVNGKKVSTISSTQVLACIKNEIDNGWYKNIAIIAMCGLLQEILDKPAQRRALYLKIKKKCFSPESSTQNVLWSQWCSATESERTQAVYLFDPIILKDRE